MHIVLNMPLCWRNCVPLKNLPPFTETYYKVLAVCGLKAYYSNVQFCCKYSFSLIFFGVLSKFYYVIYLKIPMWHFWTGSSNSLGNATKSYYIFIFSYSIYTNRFLYFPLLSNSILRDKGLGSHIYLKKRSRNKEQLEENTSFSHLFLNWQFLSIVCT